MQRHILRFAIHNITCQFIVRSAYWPALHSKQTHSSDTVVQEGNNSDYLRICITVTSCGQSLFSRSKFLFELGFFTVFKLNLKSGVAWIGEQTLEQSSLLKYITSLKSNYNTLFTHLNCRTWLYSLNLVMMLMSMKGFGSKEEKI